MIKDKVAYGKIFATFMRFTKAGNLNTYEQCCLMRSYSELLFGPAVHLVGAVHCGAKED